MASRRAAERHKSHSGINLHRTVAEGFFQSPSASTVKDVACFAERYKATWRKYNEKFIIQINSEWDAKSCSQGNVFGIYRDDMGCTDRLSYPAYDTQGNH